MATMTMEQVQPDYRYDEAKMLRGIQEYQRERRQPPTAPPAGIRLRGELPPAACRAPIMRPSVLRDPLPTAKAPLVHIAALPREVRDVCEMICEEFNVTLKELTTPCNRAERSHLRHLAFYLLIKVMGYGTAASARALGGWHHTTAIHGARVTCERMQQYPAYRTLVSRMEKQLTRGMLSEERVR